VSLTVPDELVEPFFDALEGLLEQLEEPDGDEED
jgi:hypothetical protein